MLQHDTLEVSSVPCWLPLPDTMASSALTESSMTLKYGPGPHLLPKDIKMPPNIPATGALRHVSALCFNLIIGTYLGKAELWQLGLDR